MFLIPKIRLFFRKYVPYRIVRSKDYQDLLLRLGDNNDYMANQALEYSDLLLKLIEAKRLNQELEQELEATRKIANIFSN